MTRSDMTPYREPDVVVCPDYHERPADDGCTTCEPCWWASLGPDYEPDETHDVASCRGSWLACTFALVSAMRGLWWRLLALVGR